MAFIITKPLIEHKMDSITKVNASAGLKVTSIYPIYKQLNISRTPESPEAVAMFTYIDSIRSLSNIANFSITSATDIAQIQEAETNFNNSLLLIV